MNNEANAFRDLILRSKEKHRLGTYDIEWAKIQRKGKPLYVQGDIVEFEAGGMGIIGDINPAQGDWPTSYSCGEIKGCHFHPEGKTAWHYEGDIKRIVINSSIRMLGIPK